jgi:hypothetical protein
MGCLVPVGAAQFSVDVFFLLTNRYDELDCRMSAYCYTASGELRISVGLALPQVR